MQGLKPPRIPQDQPLPHIIDPNAPATHAPPPTATTTTPAATTTTPAATTTTPAHRGLTPEQIAKIRADLLAKDNAQDAILREAMKPSAPPQGEAYAHTVKPPGGSGVPQQ